MSYGDVFNSKQVSLYKKQLEMFKKMTPKEREEYRKKKLEELRKINLERLRLDEERNDIIDEIVASQPTIGI